MENKLLLIWRGTDEQVRRRFHIGTLSWKDNKYYFSYGGEIEQARDAGFNAFPGFDDLSKTYESDGLFPNISSRLPNSSRPDYLDILNAYNLTPDSEPIDQLIATKGRLVTDNYEFVPDFTKGKIEFDVAGTRHHQKEINECASDLVINEKLSLRQDSQNKYDKYAVEVVYSKDGKDYIIGYVPRYYSEKLSKKLDDNIKYSAQISRVLLRSPIRDEDISVRVKLLTQ